MEMHNDLCTACIEDNRNVVLNILANAPTNARRQILNGEQHKIDEKSALYMQAIENY